MLRQLSLLLFLLLLSTGLGAQKLDGTWKRIARKGNDPCAVDMQMVFSPSGGPVTVLHGAQYVDCKPTTEEFQAWAVEKKMVRNKKVKVIALTLAPDEIIYMVLLEFDGEFMKVRAEVPDGDTTAAKELIFKRMD